MADMHPTQPHLSTAMATHVVLRAGEKVHAGSVRCKNVDEMTAAPADPCSAPPEDGRSRAPEDGRVVTY
jgi:hypothetical protein